MLKTRNKLSGLNPTNYHCDTAGKHARPNSLRRI